MATTWVSLGTVAWPEPLAPQPATVPSALSARLWKLPAAMATTCWSPLGTVVWPELLSPQAKAVPRPPRWALGWPPGWPPSGAALVAASEAASSAPSTTSARLVRIIRLHRPMACPRPACATARPAPQQAGLRLFDARPGAGRRPRGLAGPRSTDPDIA